MWLSSLKSASGSFSSVVLTVTIISKVTNAINMGHCLLITLQTLGLSSAHFNLHNHSYHKQSFNHQTALQHGAQYSNQAIHTWSDWRLGYYKITFKLQWTVEGFPMGTLPECDIIPSSTLLNVLHNLIEAVQPIQQDHSATCLHTVC